jgi:ferredoxin
VPTVIINDVAYEAQPGERLLTIARRNAAHIGFACDGQGICQTCQCRVLAGAEHLSKPNEAEKIWMPESRLAHGHRLACQTALRGPGPVSILTGVEEFRRQVQDVLRFGDERDIVDRMEPMLENLVRASVDQLRGYPANMLATIARVGPQRFLWPWADRKRLDGWLNDAGRITRRMSGGALPGDTSRSSD